MPEGWTTAQAAFVLNEPLDALKKIVERGPVKARVVRSGGLRVRKFALTDLIFLRAERELRTELTPKGRAELYRALAKLPDRPGRGEVAFGPFKFAFGRYLAEVEARLKELDRLADDIDTSEGEAVIKGTRIEAHRIAALLDGGMSVESVLRDYPSLSEHQVIAARAYAEINPKVGRPYPKMTAKAALRGTGLDALDDPE